MRKEMAAGKRPNKMMMRMELVTWTNIGKSGSDRATRTMVIILNWLVVGIFILSNAMNDSRNSHPATIKINSLIKDNEAFILRAITERALI